MHSDIIYLLSYYNRNYSYTRKVLSRNTQQKAQLEVASLIFNASFDNAAARLLHSFHEHACNDRLTSYGRRDTTIPLRYICAIAFNMDKSESSGYKGTKLLSHIFHLRTSYISPTNI